MKEEFPILEIASEKFPRAYSLLEESIDLEEGFNRRDLYDFFDDNGFYIEITISPSAIDDNCPAFEFTIRRGDGSLVPVDVSLFGYQRFKTEFSAFYNAFKVLEEHLVGKNTQA
ncbi:hypothetical protein [Dyadobacter sp. OTU695]|uniref:hypothetical protein n=1 Tax=Dyadobacter sp. OTU695 TaxID=3043860 RepID=UPI00313D00EE